jgi:hypothetical protein
LPMAHTRENKSNIVKNQEARQTRQSHRLHLPLCAKLCNSLRWMTQRLRCLKQTRASPAFHSRRYRHLRKIKVAHVNVIQKESWCLSNELTVFQPMGLCLSEFILPSCQELTVRNLRTLWCLSRTKRSKCLLFLKVTSLVEVRYSRGIGPVDLDWNF